MPRPLHATAMRNPTKTQNTFAIPVGADLCVGPLHTSRLRARAHTQVRLYKVGMGSLIDHTSEPGGPLPTGGLITQEQTSEYPSAKRFGCGHWPPAKRSVRGHCPPLLVGKGGLWYTGGVNWRCVRRFFGEDAARA